ncbi:MAG: response regulator [Betaproteobacteria bacterium]|nr:response regulator [Betaproteobacteria bacterium]
MERLRILVVDDSLDTARTLTYLLRDSGHLAEYAINGASALELAKRHRPELVLIDIGLPDYDGVKLAKDMKNTPGLGHVRIIALTGRNSDDEERGLAAGCELFLTKTVDPRTLEKTILRLAEGPISAKATPLGGG